MSVGAISSCGSVTTSVYVNTPTANGSTVGTVPSDPTPTGASPRKSDVELVQIAVDVDLLIGVYIDLYG